MALSSELLNLTSLNTESFTRFLEQCQQKGLCDDQILHLIIDDIKCLIKTKLKSKPTPGYSIAQNNDWENEIPFVELLQHCKTMETHNKQTNDAIIQTALEKKRFDLDLADESSIDKITINIRNALIRDLPCEIKTNYELQRVC